MKVALCRFGAFADPWPGPIDIREATTGAAVARLNQPAFIGALAAPMKDDPPDIWAREAPLFVLLHEGHLASVSPDATLSGANRLAIRHDEGDWEVIGFAEAELIAPGLYRLGGILRGLHGTRPGTAGTDAPVLVIDSRIRRVPVPSEALGASRTLRAYAGPHDAEGTTLVAAFDFAPALPLPPGHISARRAFRYRPCHPAMDTPQPRQRQRLGIWRCAARFRA